METFILRFPTVTQKIFMLLDNQSLVTSKIVDKSWYNYINTSKDHSYRLIVRTIGKRNLRRMIWLKSQVEFITYSPPELEIMKVIKKTNANTRKEIAIAYKKFSLNNDNYKFVEWNIQKECHPLNIAVDSGKMELCNHVIEKLGLDKILHSNECTTEFKRSEKYRLPLLMAAYKGHSEIFKMLYGHIDAKMGHSYVTKLCIETLSGVTHIG